MVSLSVRLKFELLGIVRRRVVPKNDWPEGLLRAQQILLGVCRLVDAKVLVSDSASPQINPTKS